MFRKISLFAALLIPISLHAETGYETWLRYAALDDLAAQQYRAVVPATLTTLNDAGLEQSAQLLLLFFLECRRIVGMIEAQALDAVIDRPFGELRADVL